MSGIENSLSALRQKRGLSAAQLAQVAGVSRQTIYAMEAGTYVPNTAVALRLARALAVRVEDLFRLDDEGAIPLREEKAALLPGDEVPREGQPVQVCRVDGRLYCSPPSPIRWYFPASDAVMAERPVAHGKASVQLFDAAANFGNRILVAGCDPGISVLARHVQAAGLELVLAHRNSVQALELLKQGCVHLAGTHLRDEQSGESNVAEVGKMFRKGSVAVVSFAVWEEGILTARGNPKGIRGVEDFGRPDVVIANRETGSGSRRLLDARLKQAGIPTRSVRGYEQTAPGHLPAAWRVKTGEADGCIATRAAARVFGLGFIPLVTERYDLVVKTSRWEEPGVQALFETLQRSRFRRELESLGGYDTKRTGERVF